jgi:hypothetical protein
VSHTAERKEKNCLNCGATVIGRFCHICGQENVEPKESFWHMATHFFYDITHFDSKFFVTIKDLIFRPGFLSKEYIKGRRVTYLHPVRMYVFTSALFFLVFFSFFKNDKKLPDWNNPVTLQQREDYIQQLRERLQNDSGDIVLTEKLQYALDTSHPLTVKDILAFETSGLKISFGKSDYHSLKEYDSLQNTLSADKKDGWLKRRIIEKELELKEKYEENPREFSTLLWESVLHRMPYMLFISLPLFAFLLKLLYWRRRQFYYMDHGIFTIHFYIFSFVLLLVVFGLNALQKSSGLGFIGYLIAALYIGLLFYLYKAMRNFYGQKRFKTLIKFFIVALFSLIMMLILFLLFLLFSAVTI